MRGWNHNIQYHRTVISAIPDGCGLALDVGCGRGDLARKMAQSCREVVAIDADAQSLSFATAVGCQTNIRFVNAEVMSHPLPAGSFDLISAVATLHHLPLRPALLRFRWLLKPGGTLVVVGLYRMSTPADYTCAAAALPLSWIRRAMRPAAEVGAPLSEPRETLAEIRAGCDRILPSGDFRRRWFYRYSFVWRKPDR